MSLSHGPTLSGILLVDKPEGPTSHDVVQQARRVLGIRRIGHTGTLDPFASGLLILCVGRATRLAEYFHIPAKRYEARVRLGMETTTHDRSGDIVAESAKWRDVSRERLEEALGKMVGAISQRPPAVSAKRVEGRRAHALVRSGCFVALPDVQVTVHELRVLEFRPPMFRLAAHVSTGTYVRAIARDLGRDLGCGAHLTALRRVAIGHLRASDGLPGRLLSRGVTREEVLQAAAWREPGAEMTWLPSRELTDEELGLARNGRPLRLSGSADRRRETDEEAPRAHRPVRLLHGGRLVAIAEPNGLLLRPRKVLID
ncbi:MAG: tRNA pseudouridine(55) synthase TruB [Gemmatimonadota bacterium]